MVCSVYVVKDTQWWWASKLKVFDGTGTKPSRAEPLRIKPTNQKTKLFYQINPTRQKSKPVSISTQSSSSSSYIALYKNQWTVSSACRIRAFCSYLAVSLNTYLIPKNCKSKAQISFDDDPLIIFFFNLCNWCFKKLLTFHVMMIFTKKNPAPTKKPSSGFTRFLIQVKLVHHILCKEIT